MSWSRGKQIFFSVMMAHVFFVLMLLADHWIHRAKAPRKKIAVYTSVAAPPPKIVSSTAIAPTAKTTAATTNKPAAKKPAPSAAKKSEALLLKEIEKSFESLAVNPTPPKKTEIAIPMLNLQVENQESELAADDLFAAFLQEALILPEHGEVKIKLTISRFGKLKDLEILASRSRKNEEFLKNRLPELQFPCLNEETTLTIVFSNAN